MVSGRSYDCFLHEDTSLPIMSIDVAVKETLILMEAPTEKLSIRSSYHLNLTSFSPGELTAEIKIYIDGVICVIRSRLPAIDCRDLAKEYRRSICPHRLGLERRFWVASNHF